MRRSDQRASKRRAAVRLRRERAALSLRRQLPSLIQQVRNYKRRTTNAPMYVLTVALQLGIPRKLACRLAGWQPPRRRFNLTAALSYNYLRAQP